MKLKVVMCLVIFALCNQVVNADYIFTAPPRENEVEGISKYGPLVKKLSQVLGETVVYEQPHNWLEYAKKMRHDEYDIVFDGPHFTAWRIKHLDHIPLVSLPGQLKYYLVTYKTYSKIKKYRDLVGRQICALPSPFLGTDMVLAIFDNPAIQPILYEVHGGIQNLYKAFKEKRCLGTIVRDKFYNKLPAEEKNKLKIIAKTRSVPNQTISISIRLKSKANKLIDFLMSDDGKSAARKVLIRYSKGAQYFQRPKKVDFDGVEDVLEGVVFGW
jgi:ABC-type phosphate/phosphonate transport system substrate-binding protein